MIHLQQLAATYSYWYPREQAQRERDARQASLASSARTPKPAAPAPTPRRSLVPRIAGALGLF